MSVTVYIKPDKNTEVTQREVTLGQLCQVWCRDKPLEAKCKAIKVMTIHDNQENRYVIPGIKLVELIQQADPRAEVINMGEQDVIIDYQPKAHRIGTIDWVKTFFVCLIVFFGGAFAIMTFNNDGSVSKIFEDVDRLVSGSGQSGQSGQLSEIELQSEDGRSKIGGGDSDAAMDSGSESSGQESPAAESQGNQKKSTGVMILEISYSVGLILGVTIFFNHFGKRKVTLDPTPIEVQMRLYEDQVETTVIRNASRKESGVDVQ